MKVFITGATGFIGAHTALALLGAGHELRLLVRDIATAKRYFSDKGFQLDDFIVADMRDKEAVQTAMKGCDAVFHAAALVSLDVGKAGEVINNNIEGVDSVVGSAHRLGIKNIVYVSSNSVLFQPGIKAINEDVPLARPKEAYARSKIECERYVRKLQSEGMPVQITYLPGVFGPDDPKMSESNKGLISFLEMMVPTTSSGLQVVDVRDVAKAHLYLLENPPKGDMQDARYVVGGQFIPWQDVHSMLEGVCAEKISNPTIPGSLLRVAGSLFDLLKKIYPFESPISSEAMAIVTRCMPTDSRKIVQKSGLEFRAAEDTFFDTIQWLVKAGHIDKKYKKQGI